MRRRAKKNTRFSIWSRTGSSNLEQSSLITVVLFKNPGGGAQSTQISSQSTSTPYPKVPQLTPLLPPPKVPELELLFYQLRTWFILYGFFFLLSPPLRFLYIR